MKDVILTWSDFNDLCVQLSIKISDLINIKKIDSIYGVPKGGSFVAIKLSEILDLKLLDNPEQGCLIVDDICDSGKTLKRFSEYNKATLFSNYLIDDNHFNVLPKTGWVVFPWEKNEYPAEDSVIRMLESIGENPNREGLLDTPKRVVKSWSEIYSGYNKNPAEILNTTFEDDLGNYDQIILLKDIELYSNCEHHLQPFFGKAHVGYIPDKKVVGLSKLARLVDIFSKRLQIQERLTTQIANAINDCLKPIGVGVIIEAKHFCMLCRGVGKQNSIMTTSCLLGEMRASAKDEFLKLCLK